jgi:hypothetical protein
VFTNKFMHSSWSRELPMSRTLNDRHSRHCSMYIYTVFTYTNWTLVKYHNVAWIPPRPPTVPNWPDNVYKNTAFITHCPNQSEHHVTLPKGQDHPILSTSIQKRSTEARIMLDVLPDATLSISRLWTGSTNKQVSKLSL